MVFCILDNCCEAVEKSAGVPTAFDSYQRLQLEILEAIFLIEDCFSGWRKMITETCPNNAIVNRKAFSNL